MARKSSTDRRKKDPKKIRGAVQTGIVQSGSAPTAEDIGFAKWTSQGLMLDNMQQVLQQNPNYTPIAGEVPVLNADGKVDVEKTLENIGYQRTSAKGSVSDENLISGMSLYSYMPSLDRQKVLDVNQRFLENGNRGAIDSLVFNRMLMKRTGKGFRFQRNPDEIKAYIDISKAAQDVRNTAEMRKFMLSEEKKLNKIVNSVKKWQDVLETNINARIQEQRSGTFNATLENVRRSEIRKAESNIQRFEKQYKARMHELYDLTGFYIKPKIDMSNWRNSDIKIMNSGMSSNNYYS